GFLPFLFSPVVADPSLNANLSFLEDAALDDKIAAAASAPPGPTRDALWREANIYATETVAIIPYSWAKANIYYGPRLANVVYNLGLAGIDWPNVRINR